MTNRYLYILARAPGGILMFQSAVCVCSCLGSGWYTFHDMCSEPSHSSHLTGPDVHDMCEHVDQLQGFTP
jgi:hypothetical protein